MSGDDASIQMRELVARRAEAEARIEAIEAEQQAAAQARQEARLAVVDAERHGASATERRKAESALSEAEAKPSILSARLEGAREASNDARRDLRVFIGEHLGELVDEREAHGRQVVERINAACESLVEAFTERESIANQIAELASLAGGRVRPGDISRTSADAVADAARRLLMQGGERAPTLDRDPRQPRHGAPAETIAAA